MNTAIINIRTKVKVKQEAQKVAGDLGFSLSSLLNAYLKDLIKSKTVHFSLEEKPNAYLRKVLKESDRDIKAGRVSPTFTNKKEAIKWLER